MEAATLTSPQRKHNVVPIQKSLSLPSYAKAGGEGIDHRLIFAALEQKEKVRRKSKIFAREKSSRQNIFCLPISSKAKCKETSLSSDTSCSSLEYQKSKPVSKPKKDDARCAPEKRPVEIVTRVNESEPAAKTNQQPETSKNSPTTLKDVVDRNAMGDASKSNFALKVSETHRKGHRSPVDTLKPNVGSSDSMDRSSRSSSDSLSRKERLVAIKARVEAAREKYGESSSEEETRTSITRYNSDGVIHRTVREVKSRSTRMEKRLRRRSQDEWAMKKANRKNNLSLCLNSAEDGVKLHLDRPSDISAKINNYESKTDFCPSPNFPDLTKKNYFSDYSSKENVVRIVQARIKHIEEEERKRRNSVELREKPKLSHHSPNVPESASPGSAERKNKFFNQNASSKSGVDKNASSTDVVNCVSPSPRSSQAPTPPPRSPKSMTYVNKAIIQHQNATIMQYENRSLERKSFFQANIPAVSYNRPGDKINSRSEVAIRDSKNLFEHANDSSEKRRIRELLNSRRKTCGFFDFAEKNILSEFGISPESVISSKPNVMLNGPKQFAVSNSQERSIENKGYFSSSETPSILNEGCKRNLCRSKWEETERRHEFMFNSLESRKKGNSQSWLRWRGLPDKSETCLCHVISGDKSSCTCNSNQLKDSNNVYGNSHFLSAKLEGTSDKTNPEEALLPEPQHPSSRLSKSEANIAFVEKSKSSPHIAKAGDLYSSLSRQPGRIQDELMRDKTKLDDAVDKISATANLESAMEELENVYRSLKFSSDNLSEKNSVSNVSLSEDDINPSNDGNSYLIKNCTNMKEAPFSGCSEKTITCKVSRNDVRMVHHQKYPEYLKSFVQPTSKPPPSPVDNSVSQSLCIDELFNDLTRQLDIEHKLLKESRDGRNQNQTASVRSDKCDKSDNKDHQSPLESLVSIRRELYNNLQRSSSTQVRDSNHATKENSNIAEPQTALVKKKYKAVRSLSANISYLMATANSDSMGSDNTRSNKPDASSCTVQTSLIEKPLPKQYEHVVLESPKTEIKKEFSLKQPKPPERIFGVEKLQNPKNDEIRHIRVSMDSNVAQSKPVMKNSFSNAKDYPRLSAAVSRPQTSPKNETSGRFNREVSTSSKENIDILDETGLEKLLNTLLSDVPESKQSSLLLPKDVAPMTPPPVGSGEMLVMQHLDVLRLNPIPS